MDQGLAQLLPLVLIGVVFYFLLIRPQQKRAKAHREMIGAVRRGDSVVTAGGIMGKVTKVRDDNVVQIEIAPEVRIDVVKSTLADVKSKTEPVAAGADENKTEGDKPEGENPVKKLFKK
ncbi:MAG: preprotein translocase subunit YajC [Sneathiella sp.]|jgi:preprotein translocase subunit YajC|uniref:preprotein translocase subunit YajC n=1 Tax=Sneathiella sp. TaxID=1964365 RepID=UPI000C3C1EC9|nr:preprotein translocase subunit YajC [Sneathiella sp.]MAL80161.1 preprotein translocase subunit YajC [Sneathiella sp.]|tara:strand:+ start:136 stop:492 length:357 start_codon:yes stop_codon:yes gene_type:complete